MRGHGDGTRRKPIRGCRGGHGSGGVNKRATSEWNIVPTDVGGICDEALARCHDLRLIGCKSCPCVPIEYALKPVNRIVRISEQGPAEELVVKSSTEDSTLRLVELGAEVVIVLDVCDQLLDLSGTGLTGCDRLELVVDRVALSQKSRPEVGLRLVILELQDRTSFSMPSAPLR